jgi:hypothetical protein
MLADLFTLMFGMGTKHAGLFAILTTGHPIILPHGPVASIIDRFAAPHSRLVKSGAGCTFILYLSYLNTARCMESKLNSIELGGRKKIAEMDNHGKAQVR